MSLDEVRTPDPYLETRMEIGPEESDTVPGEIIKKLRRDGHSERKGWSLKLDTINTPTGGVATRALSCTVHE